MGGTKGRAIFHRPGEGGDFAAAPGGEGAGIGPVRRAPHQPDDRAAEEGCLRVIDESGEDYLYPATFFVPIELPRGAGRSLSITKR